MPRLLQLLAVSFTLLLLAQARRSHLPKHQEDFVPKKKNWSQYSAAEHNQWKIEYEQSPFQERMPWYEVSDEFKATFAHTNMRKKLSSERRALKKKLISTGKYDPKRERIVFKNPHDLMAWSIQVDKPPRQDKKEKIKKKEEKKRHQKDRPKIKEFEDKLQKLRDQLSSEENSADKKVRGIEKNLIDAILKETGKVLTDPGRVLEEAANGIFGGRPGFAPRSASGSSDEVENGDTTDSLIVVLVGIAQQLVDTLTPLQTLLTEFIANIGSIPIIGPILAPLTDGFQELADFLAFVITTLQNFIDDNTTTT